MAGGANYVLDKGYPVLSTYNGSSTNGVTPFRVVKFSSAKIDLQTTAGGQSIGVVQEKIDQVKVAYGNAVAGVRLAGITKVYVSASGSVPSLGSEVEVSTDGGVVVASGTSGRWTLGVVVGQTVAGGTIGNGDLIDVLIQPRKQ